MRPDPKGIHVQTLMLHMPRQAKCNLKTPRKLQGRLHLFTNVPPGKIKGETQCFDCPQSHMYATKIFIAFQHKSSIKKQV
mmetsp:Transcript_13174/g.19381  ORF Transcript_13174/g.19381 Transcript_13174/m.19381 type:complete len:80 (+) Transcript_13174:1794-2033(+)